MSTLSKPVTVARLFLLMAISTFLLFFTTTSKADEKLSDVSANYKIKAVDFLERYDLEVNGAGPLLVKADSKRNRVILVNTHTSSVSVVSGEDHSVVNIPVKNRVSQHLKLAAVSIDDKTGNIYLVGNKCLHVVFVDEGRSITIETGDQYEMVSVYAKNGDGFLVGQESKDLAWVQLSSKTVKHVPWLSHSEPKVNLNMTPSPPIRKVVVDNSLGRVVAVDGFTSKLYLFDAQNGKLLSERKLPVDGGSRWHMAGYDEKTHHLYTVIETKDRVATEAARIAITKGKDKVVKLPGLQEAVGINYNPKRREVYIPYDNDPVVHVVDFKGVRAPVVEVAIPNFGNDATAVDVKNDRLYVASWGYGEVEVVDLKRRRTVQVIKDVGILPHMFNMDFNSANGKLYIPIGATAVNGSFGASLNVLNPSDEKKEIVYTGWAPTALAPERGASKRAGKGFLVFNNENEVAHVKNNGEVSYEQLPVRFINNAASAPDGTVYVSYGPHQSYWPAVYIWAAKNGILTLGQEQMSLYDRRIPRMAHEMAFDKNGVFYALQNNWGGEEQFMVAMPDHVRNPNLDRGHINLSARVTRETTQRILKYDPDKHWLYIVKTGEHDRESGILQVFDIEKNKVLLSYPTGLTPTDLVFDDENIYVANFDSDTITSIKKDAFAVSQRNTGSSPFKLAKANGKLFCINHKARALQLWSNDGVSSTYSIPSGVTPSNLVVSGKKLIVTGHTMGRLFVFSFDPKRKKFETIFTSPYPYGETTVDTDNSAFYMRGQFGDGIFELNQIKTDGRGRIWVTDYLSGRLFIIQKK